jgi:hypothetical protein
MLERNLFEVYEFGQLNQLSFDPDKKSVVFISYRRTICDKYEARKCAGILKDVGLSYWLDEDDKCMQDAQGRNDDVQTALCIEAGLDVSSALLGIIGRCTFDSPWIPYEIGGARGRQRYVKAFRIMPPKTPHPLIAHYIHDVPISEVPAFVALGTPLREIDEVANWAKSVAAILERRQRGERVSLNEAQGIQADYGIQGIYDKNAPLLKRTPRW